MKEQAEIKARYEYERKLKDIQISQESEKFKEKIEEMKALFEDELVKHEKYEREIRELTAKVEDGNVRNEEIKIQYEK